LARDAGPAGDGLEGDRLAAVVEVAEGGVGALERAVALALGGDAERGGRSGGIGGLLVGEALEAACARPPSSRPSPSRPRFTSENALKSRESVPLA